MKNQKQNSRREFLKKTSLLTLGGIAGLSAFKSFASTATIITDLQIKGDVGEFTLPPLPYSYDALVPSIDKMTMEIHHDKHHAGYVKNLNKAVEENKLQKISLNDLLKNVSKYSVAVRNNAGGHWNHSFFWKLMKSVGEGKPSGKLLDAINASFGSFEEFKTKFNDAAAKRFGSGWAWLVLNKKNKLEIGSTPNQDNPLMDICDFKGTPILALDVWEHAYYLNYQNKRTDYVNAWWNLVNWEEAGTNFTNSN